MDISVSKFIDITYLKNGNDKQIAVYDTLIKHNIFQRLSNYNPILVGTIPIGIDIGTSDLDIICHINSAAEFLHTLFTQFGDEKRFTISENNSFKSVKANFSIDGFDFELFGQHIPTTQQYGYRHLIIEDRFLSEKGEAFKQEIIRLKNEGIKTEPAFAMLLGLEGNPYEALLAFEQETV